MSTNKITDDDMLDMVEEIMERLTTLGSPDKAALVLLACHAQNYELNATRKLTMDKYLERYCEMFKGFFKEMKQ